MYIGTKALKKHKFWKIEKKKKKKSLKLVSAIFYQIFIFSPNDSPSKSIKCFYFI